MLTRGRGCNLRVVLGAINLGPLLFWFFKGLLGGPAYVA